ncbi:carbonate dehydratase [Cupriavidus taiwanensis]|uniref:carbonate dehydratase n=1 Tax=Cupriavidus taiwanensis TaxID=164546 RepID=UPI003F752504
MEALELDELLDNNRRWAHRIAAEKPGFFESLSRQQAPECLWIGCADSRVPANELVGLQPGELFVHRNIANVVAHSDLNCLSVLQYAVDMLKVRHVIVVGHSGCGGVKAALEGLRIGLADNWVRHVRDAIEKHSSWLGSVAKGSQLDAACELNVLEQVRNACSTTVMLDAWERGQDVAVQGMNYGLHNGLLKSMMLTVRSPNLAEATYTDALGKLQARFI